jgi:hypothetical protein
VGGIMNLAIFGNIVTSFSWFGVDMLGIGLYSYGFMDAAFKWLMIFIGSQVIIILVGLLPLPEASWTSSTLTRPQLQPQLQSLLGQAQRETRLGGRLRQHPDTYRLNVVSTKKWTVAEADLTKA